MKIAKDNKILLEKINKIPKHGTLDNLNTRYKGKSIQLAGQIRTNLNIDYENKLFCERLSNITSVYDNSQWESEYNRYKANVERINVRAKLSRPKTQLKTIKKCIATK